MALTDKITDGKYKNKTVQDALNDIGQQAYLSAIRTDFLANKASLVPRLDALLTAVNADDDNDVALTPEQVRFLAEFLASRLPAEVTVAPGSVDAIAEASARKTIDEIAS